MKDSLILSIDTIPMYEWTLHRNDQDALEIDLPYDPKIDVYVIGNVIFFSYLIYHKIAK